MAKLYYIHGAMNCGKSTNLLQVAHNYEERGMRVLLMKPSTDTKGDASIMSRLGVTRRVDVLIRPGDRMGDLVAPHLAHVGCVLIDEAQFLTPRQAEELHELVHTRHIPCMCYGLKIDFRAAGFPGSSRLLELADEIRELRTICQCGRRATMNLRLMNGVATFSGSQVEVDDQGDIRYVSVCGDCFYKIRNGEMRYDYGEAMGKASPTDVTDPDDPA
ncbi:thymidine kinase [Olsenella uli]|uniref:thymidine kinase n=1 Tax=Olsenella uli TaxID=133926 RepID=UPI0028D1AEE2|nr:thymidine kinase [Olsenella uli]